MQQLAINIAISEKDRNENNIFGKWTAGEPENNSFERNNSFECISIGRSFN